MTRRADLTNEVFGCLTALRHIGGRKWECKCSCGATTAVAIDKLRSGHTSSCGHLRVDQLKARSTKHGHAGRHMNSPEYVVWAGMIGRCTNPLSAAWPSYGGRGITVCRRWLRFENFYTDMGPRPAGTTLDRKNNNRGYSPANCRWATRMEQSRNTRRTRNVTLNGDTRCIADWATEFGINKSTVYYWIGRYGDADAIRRLSIKYGTTIKVEV